MSINGTILENNPRDRLKRDSPIFADHASMVPAKMGLSLILGG
jgi:hypothetical protein